MEENDVLWYFRQRPGADLPSRMSKSSCQQVLANVSAYMARHPSVYYTQQLQNVFAMLKELGGVENLFLRFWVLLCHLLSFNAVSTSLDPGFCPTKTNDANHNHAGLIYSSAMTIAIMLNCVLIDAALLDLFDKLEDALWPKSLLSVWGFLPGC